MIEIPAGGLKWKIGQKGTLKGRLVYFAPDYRSWDWFFVVPTEPSVSRFTDLIDAAREFGVEIEEMHAQTIPGSGGRRGASKSQNRS